MFPNKITALDVARRTFTLRSDPEMGGLTETELRGVAADQLSQEWLRAEAEAAGAVA